MIARAKEKANQQLNLKDLGAICLWKKQPGDSALESTRTGLLEQYAVRKDRQDPPYPETNDAESITMSCDENEEQEGGNQWV